MRVFLSHNKVEREVARSLGAHLILVGADVWFDEWEVQAGDSIPGKLNEGLESFDHFILLWSKAAARSEWVRRELHSAISYAIENKSAKIVPCLLDDTPLPALIRDIKGVSFANPADGIRDLVADLLGMRSRRDLLLAVQAALQGLDLTWSMQAGMEPYICRPKCGNEDSLKGWHATDVNRGDKYAGLKCTNCGWEEGGEVP